MRFRHVFYLFNMGLLAVGGLAALVALLIDAIIREKPVGYSDSHALAALGIAKLIWDGRDIRSGRDPGVEG